MVSSRVAPPVAWAFQCDCFLKVALQGNFRCGYEKLLRRNHPFQWPTCGLPNLIRWRVVKVSFIIPSACLPLSGHSSYLVPSRPSIRWFLSLIHPLPTLSSVTPLTGIQIRHHGKTSCLRMSSISVARTRRLSALFRLQHPVPLAARLSAARATFPAT
jgi:hypothetical protein